MKAKLILAGTCSGCVLAEVTNGVSECIIGVRTGIRTDTGDTDKVTCAEFTAQFVTPDDDRLMGYRSYVPNSGDNWAGWS